VGLELISTVSPNEAADLLPSVDIEEFAVGAVALRLGGVLALASLLSADLILERDAAWMHRPEGAQLLLNQGNFFFPFLGRWFRFHFGYVR